MLDSLSRDLRYAARTLWKSPGFTAAAAITLALGIGVNAAIFSVVNVVLLGPLPYREADRLTMIWEKNRAGGEEVDLVSPADFADWSADGRLFEQMAASRDASYSLTGSGDPELISGYRFSAGFFPLLGVAPAIGRTFAADEDRPGGDHVVVLSHALWLRRFRGEPGIVGRSITLDGAPYSVIGVMPAGFQHPPRAELWTPLAMDAGLQASRSRRFLRVAARLRPGVSLQEAQAGMDAIMRGLEARHPDTNAQMGAKVVALREQYVGDIKPALLMLLGAVGFVLLMACGNVAHLVLARSAGRRRELAIRAALGAGRPRLVRQMLTESLLLCLLGGALGLLLAVWCAGLLVALFPNNIANLSIPIVKEIPIDWRVLGFTTGLSMITGLLFGLAPALQTTRQDVNETLKQTPRGDGAGAAGAGFRGLLVAVETATALVLLAGAGLMIGSFLRLQQAELGLAPRGVLTGQVVLPQAGYPNLAKRRLFVDSVLQRLERIPGVESAGATNFLPLSGFWGTVRLSIEGQPPPRAGEEPEADNRLVSPGYFKTMGIRLVKGRDFTARDGAGAAPVAIVNEAMARRYWPGEDPIGKRVDLGPAGAPDIWEVVGVVSDVRSFGLEQEPHAELFRPLEQVTFPLLAFTVRAPAGTPGLADGLRRAIWEVDGQLPVFKLLSMQQLADESLALRRISMLLLGAFAALAIALAAAGIYGVISCTVSQRTGEIGIRMALGARPAQLSRWVMGLGMRPLLAGVAIGLPAALGLTRLVRGLLYGLTPADPWTHASAVILLILVGLGACYLPARRAIRIDPIAALRQG